MFRDDRVQCPGCLKRYFPAQAWAHKGCVANTVANANPGVDNADAPLELAPVAKPERYGRYADGEKRRAYMRGLMRKRRAEGKA